MLLTLRSVSLAALLLTSLSAGGLARADFDPLASEPVQRSTELRHRYWAPLPRMTLPQARAWFGQLVVSGFDIAGVNWRRRSVELVMTDSEIRRFERWSGVRGTVIATEAGPDPRYLNPTSLEAKMRELAARFPKLSHLEEIGRTTQGRPMLALELTVQGQDQVAKPAILFDGNHHAREIVTPDVVFDIAETLLTQAQTNPAVMNLLATTQIWVVPMVNPDGNAIVWSSDPMWRKNARVLAGKVVGVDINRNYDYAWGACGGSSGEPTSDTYRGPSAGSEPETQAMAKLGARIKPIANLSFHQFGELVLYPYGCENKFTPENALLARVGRDLANSLPSDDDPRGTYTSGTSWQILYPVDGGSKDFHFAATGTLSYTVEIGTEFQPPYSKRDPLVTKLRKGWQGFINDLKSNLLQIEVTDAKTGLPAVALVEFDQVPHPTGEKPFQTDALGRLFKVLDPGTYTVRAQLADGRRVQQTLVMSHQPQRLALAIH